VGQPPKVTHNSFGDDFKDNATSLHLEAFYHFQVTDNLAITPGLFVIKSPEYNDRNHNTYIGTVRTTFNF
jgi:carbohydrate-selective porin OprB